MKTTNLLIAFIAIIPAIGIASESMQCDEYAELGRQHLQDRYENAPMRIETIERAMTDKTFRIIVSQAYNEPLVENQTLGLDDFSARMFYQCLKNKV